MMTLLFPGRYVGTTRFEGTGLWWILNRAPAAIPNPVRGTSVPSERVRRIVSAITSSNMDHSGCNPIEFHPRAVAVTRDCSTHARGMAEIVRFKFLESADVFTSGRIVDEVIHVGRT